MISRFVVRNFRSYLDETILDLSPAIRTNFPDSLITTSTGGKLVPVGVVCGPNGGGKSNFLNALASLIYVVANPIFSTGLNRTPLIMQQRVPCEPFLFNHVGVGKPTEFQVDFLVKGSKYRYSISLLNNKVLSESLFRANGERRNLEMIFERSGEHISLGSEIKAEAINTSVNEKMPFLSYLAINHNFPVVAEAEMWFEECLVRNCTSPETEQRVVASLDEAVKSQTIELLDEMRFDIVDYRYDEKNSELVIYHAVNGSVNTMPLEFESDGTQRLILSLPLVFLALQDGRLIVLDDLGVHLHPEVVGKIISLFTNPNINQKGAQLLFSTQEVSGEVGATLKSGAIWRAASNTSRASVLSRRK